MTAWWQTLGTSERRLFLVALAVIAMALYFVFVVEPLHHERAALDTRIRAATTLGEDLEAIATEARKLSAGATQRTRFDGTASLLGIVNAAAADAGVDTYTRRLNPAGRTTVHVSVTAVPYDRLDAWLVALDVEHGVAVERATLERTRAGHVDAQLTLSARAATGSTP